MLQLPTSAGGGGKCIRIWESEGNIRVFPLVPLNHSPGPALWLFMAYSLKNTAYFSFFPLSPHFSPFYTASYNTPEGWNVFLKGQTPDVGLLRPANVFSGLPKPPTVQNLGLRVIFPGGLELLVGMDASVGP